MDRPKLAICAVEKAPPSFPPAFCRTLIGLPPIISLRERASERAAEQVSPTSQYVIVSRSVASPVGRTRSQVCLSTQYLSAPEAAPVSSDGRRGHRYARGRLFAGILLRARTGAIGQTADHSSATRCATSFPDTPFFFSSVLCGAKSFDGGVFNLHAVALSFQMYRRKVEAASENSTAPSFSDVLSLF